MKKILVLMGAFGLSLASTATVVACGEPTDEVDKPDPGKPDEPGNKQVELTEIIAEGTILEYETFPETNAEILALLKEQFPSIKIEQLLVQNSTLNSAEIVARPNSTDYIGKTVVNFVLRNSLQFLFLVK